MSWHKLVLTHQFYIERTYIVGGRDLEEAQDTAFLLWRQDAGNISSFNIPTIKSCVELPSTARIFRMVFEMPGHTTLRCVTVTAIDEEDAKDECMSEIYKMMGPAWNNMTTGVKMIPRAISFTEL